MWQLPDGLEQRILSFLKVFESPRMATTCTRLRHCGLSETDYVCRVKTIFTTTAPSYSGKLLMHYQGLGLVLAPDKISVLYWFL